MMNSIMQVRRNVLRLLRSGWVIRQDVAVASQRALWCPVIAADSPRPPTESATFTTALSQLCAAHPAHLRVRGSRGFCSSAGPVISFPLAQTGEGISECELMRWFIQEGDSVEEFQPVCEVQSDKASIEITSRYSGQILRLYHTVGDMVKVGAPLLDIQLPAGTSSAVDTATAASTTTTTPSTSSSSSRENADVFASPAVRRLARELSVPLHLVIPTGPAGRISKEDVEAYAATTTSLGTPPATAPTTAPAGGNAAPPPPSAAAAVEASHPKGPAGTVLGVVAKAVAKAAGVAPAGQQQAAVQQQMQAAVQQQQVALGRPSVPEEAEPGPGGQFSTSVPLRGYRRAMVKSSTEAAHIPMFHYFDEVTMDTLIATRTLLKEEAPMQGTKLTFLPFVVKALSIALLSHPGINACLAATGDALVQHHTHNIGVAMATSSGLVVPNVKQVETKTIPEIAADLQRLQQLASAGHLTSHDLQGGSLTVSNIGTVGGTNATPLVNPPEAVIVALGRVQALPRYDPVTGQLVKRHLMAVSWGGDHRVVDGAAIANFHASWKQLIEEPARMLLHLV